MLGPVALLPINDGLSSWTINEKLTKINTVLKSMHFPFINRPIDASRSQKFGGRPLGARIVPMNAMHIHLRLL